LRAPLFRWYFASRSINLVGNFMAPVALAFAVLAISHSPIALGLVLAARTIPLLIFLLLGGVIGDRWPRVRIITLTNLVSGASQGATAILVLTGRAELWQLVTLSAVNGVAAAAGVPATNGLLPQVVPRSQLQEANALVSLTRAIVAILGPSVAATLVIAASPGWALLIDAATWLLAAAAMLPVTVPASSPAGRPSLLGELVAGWHFFRSTTWLWLGVAASCLLNALYEGAFLTLGPVRSIDTAIGRGGWGLTLSVQGAGVLLATLALMRWRVHRPLLAGMLGMALFGLPMVVLGARPDLHLLLAAALLSGIGVQFYVMGWNLSLQEHVPEQMLSRASSYDQLGSFIAIPIGQLCFGPLAARFGIDWVLLISGAAYVAVSLLVLLSADVRELSRGAAEPQPQPVT
jgi:MFS family permease